MKFDKNASNNSNLSSRIRWKADNKKICRKGNKNFQQNDYDTT